MVKGPDAFRTISEAADEVGVAQHVLRFWESKLTFIRPMKRAGGRRFYRPGDIQVLVDVRRLLHAEGYTIRKVQSLHRAGGVRALREAPAQGGSLHSPSIRAERKRPPNGRSATLRLALNRLEAAKARLDALVARSLPQL